MPDAEKIPWKLQSPASWRDTVESWDWHPAGGGGFTKSGSCPICNAGITITKVGRVVLIDAMDAPDLELMVQAEDGPILVTTDDDEPDTFYARCNCGEEHPGRPERLTQGCGAWANISPPPR